MERRYGKRKGHYAEKERGRKKWKKGWCNGRRDEEKMVKETKD